MSTRRILAAFWGVLIIGIPFWWKTTEVYRAALPFDDIALWRTRQASPFILPTTFTLHIPHHVIHDAQQYQLADKLSQEITQEFAVPSSCASFPAIVTIASWDANENEADWLDRHRDAETGHYHIYFTTQPKDKVTVGAGRTAVIGLPHLSTDAVEKAALLFAQSLFSAEYKALGQLVCASDDSGDKHDINSMRTLKYASQYQVTFSLMSNDPHAMATGWDIREAVQSYLSPLLKQLAVVSNFTVDSQIQNFAPLSIKPSYNAKKGYYYIGPKELPHFVNSAEWNLASTISSYPTVNFILYIASSHEKPLLIHDAQGKPLKSNAFLIPRWGGVVIKNLGDNQQKRYQLDKEELRVPMSLFVSQLRNLMGVQDLEAMTLPPTYNLAVSGTGITVLEKDNLIRRRAIENMVNAASTLHSLAQLVMEIPNMVVLDHIHDEVRASLDALQLAAEELQAGQYDSALQHSIVATELAEKAFFDPTMVSMLYFPDEHKYAIYMPLFVPITVPLVMSVLKEFKKSRAKASAKAKVE